MNAWLLTGVYWNNNGTTIKLPLAAKVLSNVSKIKISRALNNPDEEALEELSVVVSTLEINKKLLTKDGKRLLQDLSLVRILL